MNSNNNYDEIHSDYNAITCPVCLHSFDVDSHLPKIFPTCGHTVCKECLIQVLEMDHPQCPLDKLRFDSQFRSIEAFPTNFLGKDLLEIEGTWSRCKIHNEQCKMICLDHHTLVCPNCAVFGDHKGHNIGLISDYLKTAKRKKNQLSAMSNRISKASSQLMSSLKEKKQKLKATIQERFQALHRIMTNQENQVLMKFESFFMEESIRLQYMMDNKSSSDLVSHIKSKLQEFNQITSNPNIVEIVEEDFTGLEKSLHERLDLSSTQFQEEVSELFTLLESNLPNKNLLKDFDTVTPLTQAIFEYNSKRQDKIEDQIADIKEIDIPPAELEISQESNSQILIIHESSGSTKPHRLDASKLVKIQEVQYCFEIYKRTNDKYSKKTLPVLMMLSKFLPNIKSVKIAFEPYNSHSAMDQDHLENRVHSLLSATLSQPENLEMIEINATNRPIGDLSAVFLAEKVLPRVKNLKSLICGFQKTNITGKVLQAFAQANLASKPNLETFRINVAGGSFTEEDITLFLKTVPNVKDILLGFGKTRITNQALEEFSTKILPSLNKIERLEIGFWETKLTGLGIKKFLMNIPSGIQKLLVGMRNLEVTDEVMESFLNDKLSSLTKLEELNLSLTDTKISENMKQQISNWKERIILENELSEEEFPFIQTQVELL